MADRDDEMADSTMLPLIEELRQSIEPTDIQKSLRAEHVVESAGLSPIISSTLSSVFPGSHPSKNSPAPQAGISMGGFAHGNNTGSSTRSSYDTLPPPYARVKVPQIPLTEFHNLRKYREVNLDGPPGDFNPYVSPYDTPRHVNPYKQQDPDPNIPGRPDPRYVCIVDPDPEGVYTPPTPTWKVASNNAALHEYNEAAARKLEAMTSYVAPSIYGIDELPYANHVSAGELPVHFNYFRHSGGTIKCDECRSRGRTEVYKCHHCVAQICNECIDNEIANEISMDDYQFTWKGTKLHGAFKLAYLMRKNTGDAERPFEGWISFGVPSTGAKYRVYVSIDVVPRAQKPKTNNKRRRQITEVDHDNDEFDVEQTTEQNSVSKKARRAVLEPRTSDDTLLLVTSTPTPASTSTTTTTSTSSNNNNQCILPLPAHPPMQCHQATLQPMTDAASLPADNTPMAAVLVQLPGETVPRQMQIVSLVCRDALNDDTMVALYEKILRD